VAFWVPLLGVIAASLYLHGGIERVQGLDAVRAAW
jgi:hypothetical protein